MSRRATILEIAQSEATSIVQRYAVGSAERKHTEAVGVICYKLVAHLPPVKPSVPLVVEEGKVKMSDFPAVQTIYNQKFLKEMVGVWRKAYNSLTTMETPVLDEADALRKTAPDLEPGPRALVERVLRRQDELVTRCNALKRIIDELSRVHASGKIKDHRQTIDGLGEWLEKTRNSPFFGDPFALRVSRGTPINTRVMSMDLFNDLEGMVTALQQQARSE
jgi:hypothetical protein